MLLYLDPGSGAMLVQMLVAGVAGVIVFFKYQGRRVKAFFGKAFSGKQEKPEVESRDHSHDHAEKP